MAEVDLVYQKVKKHILAKYGEVEEVSTNFFIADKNERCYTLNISLRKKGELFKRNVIVKADLDTGEVREFFESGTFWQVTKTQP